MPDPWHIAATASKRIATPVGPTPTARHRHVHPSLTNLPHAQINILAKKVKEMPRLPAAVALNLALTLALSACAVQKTAVQPAPLVEPEKTGWLKEVTPEDETRIAGLPEIWRTALAGVPPRLSRIVAKEGDLLVADAGRDHPAPPPGSYRCRLVKLGPGTRREAPVRSFPDFFCYIRAEEHGRLSFTKQTGTDLPGGWLYADGDRRLILLGARQRAVGDTRLAYGTEPERDVVGVVERIGPFRWRLTLPWRGGPAGLDLYELTPVPLNQQAEEPRVAHSDPTPAPAPTP
jgi:hypothetical protein